MRSQTLFDNPTPANGLQCVANARRSDPGTSHEAARKIESSGRADAHRRVCLNWVRQHPGRTSAEIAQSVGLDRHQAARRLPDLRRSGKVRSDEPRRICTVTGGRSMTWWPVGDTGGVA